MVAYVESQIISEERLQTPEERWKEYVDAKHQIIEESVPENIWSDLEKRRNSILDRLIVVNAGALALSMTAVSIFRAHPVGDGGVGYLFAAWKSFISSIVSTLITFYLGHWSFGIGSFAKRSRTTFWKLDWVEYNYNPFWDSKKELRGRRDKSLRKFRFVAGVLTFSVTALDIFSLVAALVGFYWLYRYARVNLHQF